MEFLYWTSLQENLHGGEVRSGLVENPFYRIPPFPTPVYMENNKHKIDSK